MMQRVVCTPLLAEHLAVRRALAPLPVLRTGMGLKRSRASVRGLLDGDARAVLVAGVGGGLQPEIRSGAVIVANEIAGEDGSSVPCPSASLLAGALRRLGLEAHVGPIACTSRLVGTTSRRARAEGGALAVEMESADLSALAEGGPFAVLRVLVDTPRAPLGRPGTIRRGIGALRTLRAAAPAIAQWMAAVGDREIVTEPADEAELRLVVTTHESKDRQTERGHGLAGMATYRVRGMDDVDLRWLAGVRTIVIGTEDGAPQGRVEQIVACLAGLGRISVRGGVAELGLASSRKVI